MNALVKRVAVGAVAGLFVGSIAAGSAFADTTAEISDNGAGSRNSILMSQKSKCTVFQSNKTSVSVNVNSQANTGGNTASGNTGGDVTIDTGDAMSHVMVDVAGSSNEATDPCCCVCDGCDSVTEAKISDNGKDSRNSIAIRQKKSTKIKQVNKTNVYIGVLSKAKTGKNKANKNTGDSVNLMTGDADSHVGVFVSSSSNTLDP